MGQLGPSVASVCADPADDCDGQITTTGICKTNAHFQVARQLAAAESTHITALSQCLQASAQLAFDQYRNSAITAQLQEARAVLNSLRLGPSRDEVVVAR